MRPRWSLLGGLSLPLLGLAAEQVFSLRGLRLDKQQSAAASASACYEAGLPASFSKDAFPFCEVVMPDVFVLYWTHNGTRSESYEDRRDTGTITFGVVSKSASHDWMALGINAEGNGMFGTDVAMLRRDAATGSFKLEDRFATHNAVPELDESQDKVLLMRELRADQGLHVFSFSMPVNGYCRDQKDVSLDPRKWAWVMWAMGNNTKEGHPSYHGSTRGSHLINLLTTREKADDEAKPVVLPADAQSMSLRLPFDTVVPSKRTTYMCFAMEMPQDQKYHVYELLPLNSTHPLVHHISIITMDTSPYPLNKAVDCTDNVALNHGAILIGVTRGSLAKKSMRALEEVGAGFALGKGYPRFWVLEAHFSNLDGVEGAVVSPGYQVSYSPTLRKYDAGSMILGAAPSFPKLNMTSPLAIPPKTERYQYVDYCSSACTKKLLPPQGVHILQVMLHAHTLATSIDLQLIRNTSGTVERIKLGERAYFEFNNQPLQVYDPPGFHLLPGDRLISRCSYNSMSRENTTWWGEGSDTEMCTVGFMYYPATDHSTFCVDTRDVHHPVLDDARRSRHGVPLPLQTCTTGQVIANVTALPNPQPTDLLKLVVNIPDDELHMRDDWRYPSKDLSPCVATTPTL